ncbi:MAG: S41 family peptidase [Pseudomonadota bacterium]
MVAGLALVCIAAVSTPALALSPEAKVSAEKVRSDLKYLRKLLSRTHPNLYAHKGPKKLRREFNAIEAKVKGEMRMGEAMVRVQQLLAAICDEHTSINLRDTFEHIDWINTKIVEQPIISTPNKVVLDEWGIKTAPVQLLGLDRLKAREMDQNLRSIISSDGCSGERPIFSRLAGFPTTMLLNYFHPRSEQYVSITRKRVPIDAEENSDVEFKVIYPFSLGAIYQRARLDLPTRRIIPLNSAGIPYERRHYYKINDRNYSGILGIVSPDKKYAYVHMGTFEMGKKQETAINEVMRKIIKENPEHVILDLTESPGGYSRSASRLLSYFLPRSHQIAKSVYRINRKFPTGNNFTPHSAQRAKMEKKFIRQFRRVPRKRSRYTLLLRRTSFGNPHFRGKVTVLVGPQTHSAATIAALVLKREIEATIIGYQSGGDTRTSCFAADGTYRLPATGIKVLIPETCFERVRSRKGRGGPLKPDIEVDPFAQPSGELLQAILQAGADHVAGRDKTAAKSN